MKVLDDTNIILDAILERELDCSYIYQRSKKWW